MPIQRQGSSFATTLQINGVVNDKTVYCFGLIRQQLLSKQKQAKAIKCYAPQSGPGTSLKCAPGSFKGKHERDISTAMPS